MSKKIVNSLTVMFPKQQFRGEVVRGAQNPMVCSGGEAPPDALGGAVGGGAAEDGAVGCGAVGGGVAGGQGRPLQA